MRLKRLPERGKRTKCAAGRKRFAVRLDAAKLNPGQRLTVHKSVPAVRIHLAPPTSLRFEAFSGEVRKLRACRGDAHGPSAPENAQMMSRCASLRFSLCGRVIRCRCQPIAERTVRAEAADIASDATRTSSFRWEKSVGLSIAF